MKRTLILMVLASGLLFPTGIWGQDERGEGRRRSDQFRQQQRERGQQGERGQRDRQGQNRGPQIGNLDGAILSQLRSLDLTEKQREQVRELMQAQRANLNIQRDPQERQRRQELIQKLRDQGLEGEELRRRVMQEMGIEPPVRGQQRGEPPRLDLAQMQQRRAELMEKLRGILTQEQMTKLEDTLRSLNREGDRRRGGGEGLQPPPTRRDRQSGGDNQGQRRGGEFRRGGGGGGR